MVGMLLECGGGACPKYNLLPKDFVRLTAFEKKKKKKKQRE
jgi:hypothetical protein